VNPAHVLAVYAEPLVDGRRVALLGPEDPSLVEAVLSLGARLVYVYDPRPKTEGVRRGNDARVTIAPLRAGDLGVREGAFDAVIAPDLSLLGDGEAALAYVRRLVGSTGVALVGCRNRDAAAPWTRTEEGAPAPSYTEFYDLCSLQFSEVKMVGVAPFAAYAVAEFAPDREPSIAFDASLITAPDPPEWFVAIASQKSDIALEAYEIVQLPREAVISADGPVTDSGEVASLSARLTASEQKCQQAEARAGEESLRAERAIAELRTQSDELRKLREKSTRHAKELEDERRVRQQAEAELGAAKKNPELSQLRERTLALEAALIEARTQLATPRTPQVDPRVREERDALANEVAKLRHRLGEREKELEAIVGRGRALEDRLAEQLAQATREGEERASSTKLAAELEALQATHEQDVAALETALRARGEELRLARTELARRERMVRELVARVEAGGIVLAPPAVTESKEMLEQLAVARQELATLVDEVRRRDRVLAEARTAFETLRRDLEIERGKTEQLARDAARREAALQTASWRIAELEKLGGAGETPDDARIRLESEIDALRRALAQEHQRASELERRLGTGPTGDAELARIEQRLREREGLIAQLSAELAARRGLEGG
jgi:predicted transcriptional regulator